MTCVLTFYNFFPLFRNEGIECLRFHRSTNDICEVDSIYESTITSGTTSFLGQTSDSFVFNGAKKLISLNRKGSYQVNQNVQEAIEDEPSYLGFSNFDEIALNKPEDLNDVTDSGVCSFSSTLQRRQRLQNLEMSDLGIPSLNPTGFTLANLRKK